jgi:hypothetical protein
VDIRYEAYCGLYCGACEILLMNELGRIEEKAKEWKMDINDIKCLGCKSNQNAIYCRECYFKKCAQLKEIDFCNQCSDFPCEKLKDFRYDKFPHHSIVFKNLNEIQEKGCKKWLDKQKIRWECTKCGQRFTWYEDLCKKCGEKLFNCIEEEKKLDG